jgi:hypothetical protein
VTRKAIVERSMIDTSLTLRTPPRHRGVRRS